MIVEHIEICGEVTPRPFTIHTAELGEQIEIPDKNQIDVGYSKDNKTLIFYINAQKPKIITPTNGRIIT